MKETWKHRQVGLRSREVWGSRLVGLPGSLGGIPWCLMLSTSDIYYLFKIKLKNKTVLLNDWFKNLHNSLLCKEEYLSRQNTLGNSGGSHTLGALEFCRAV